MFVKVFHITQANTVQYLIWSIVLPGVPQGFVLEPILWLICINHLPWGLSSNLKLFLNDELVFAKICNVNEARNKSNNDLMIINYSVGQ